MERALCAGQMGVSTMASGRIIKSMVKAASSGLTVGSTEVSTRILKNMDKDASNFQTTVESILDSGKKVASMELVSIFPKEAREVKEYGTKGVLKAG